MKRELLGPALNLMVFSVWAIPIAASIDAPVLTFVSVCIAYVFLSLSLSEVETKKDGKTPLPSFMRDLVAEAKLKKECSYSGYDKYIEELEDILCQQEKNNGILVGPPGIGKSAVFETIAWKIAHNKFPPTSPFYNKLLIGIRVTDLISGTFLRGNLEERTKEIVAFAQKNPSVVYAIDEIHKIVGAGATMHERNGGVASHLKEDLARPELKVLGATTPIEFKQYIESDPTLSRRFKDVRMKEPTLYECFEMLKMRREQGFYNNGEQKMTITEDALKAAIYFSRRDNKTKFLPDVANDLIDSVRARDTRLNKNDLTIGLDDIIKKHARDKKMRVDDLHKQFQAFIKVYKFVPRPLDNLD